MAIEGAREGFARTECLLLSGEPIGVQFGLIQRDIYSQLLIGADIERHQRLSPGLLAVDASVRAAIEAGERVYDFTIGDHPYKQQFGAQAIPLHEWHRARTLRGGAALLGIALVREAKRTLKPLLKRSVPHGRNLRFLPPTRAASNRSPALNQSVRNSVNRAVSALCKIARVAAGLYLARHDQSRAPVCSS